MKKLTLTLTVLFTLVAGTADAQTSADVARALRGIETQLQQANLAYQMQQIAPVGPAYRAPVYSNSRTRNVIGGALQGLAAGIQRGIERRAAEQAAEDVERRHGERQALLMAQHAALMTQLEALEAPEQPSIREQIQAAKKEERQLTTLLRLVAEARAAGLSDERIEESGLLDEGTVVRVAIKAFRGWLAENAR